MRTNVRLFLLVFLSVILTMDAITDILSNFFVNTKFKQARNNRKERDRKERDRKERDINKRDIDRKEHRKKKEQTSETKKKQSSEKSKSEEKSSKSEQKSSKSEEKSSKKSEKKLLLNEILERISKDTSSDTKKSSSTESKKIQDKKQSEISDKKQSEISDKKQSEKSDKKQLLKKYILKSNEFSNKSILIVNDDNKDNIDLLNDILYKLSLMKDVDKLYDGKVHVITNLENKKMYRRMILDNPYLYFTNFDIKNSITKPMLKKMEEQQSKTIYIVDGNIYLSLDDNQRKMLLSKNVHLFVMCLVEEGDTTWMVYDKLNKSNKLLLHKSNRLKTMQKQFYKNVIKNLVPFKKFEEYYSLINDENIDLKLIVLKDMELRYN